MGLMTLIKNYNNFIFCLTKRQKPSTVV
jgi:hypothetical protein